MPTLRHARRRNFGVSHENGLDRIEARHVQTHHGAGVAAAFAAMAPRHIELNAFGPFVPRRSDLLNVRVSDIKLRRSQPDPTWHGR